MIFSMYSWLSLCWIQKYISITKILADIFLNHSSKKRQNFIITIFLWISYYLLPSALMCKMHIGLVRSFNTLIFFSDQFRNGADFNQSLQKITLLYTRCNWYLPVPLSICTSSSYVSQLNIYDSQRYARVKHKYTPSLTHYTYLTVSYLLLAMLWLIVLGEPCVIWAQTNVC